MSVLGGIVINARQWLPVTLCAAAAGLLLLAWGYRHVTAGGGVRGGAFALKLIGLVALALCLLDPMVTGERAKPGANLFVVLADNSASLSLLDEALGATRAQRLTALLDAQAAIWPAELNNQFDVRRYRFDARLQRVDEFGVMPADGRATAMGAALRAMTERYTDRPLAGVLLFTDGNATDLPVERLASLGALPPIYPVVIGSDRPGRDVSIRSTAVSQTAFEDAPVTITADVTASGYAGRDITVELLNEAGQVMQTHREEASRDEAAITARFMLKPATTGVSFYYLRAAAPADGDGEVAAERDKPAERAATTPTTEATFQNNTRALAVDRGVGPYRVLYIGGRPNWEYKFLQRAVAEDHQIEMAAIVRIAKREPKFSFRSKFASDANPLFQAFGDNLDEDNERFDRPVLVRLNVKDESELRDGFPKTAEQLYRYHAIMLDDVEAEFFTREQMLLMEKFVSERGGGLVMLGGLESFDLGGYDRTPIGRMLPVYLGQGQKIQPIDNARLTLTREGWLQPWTRLRRTEAQEQLRLDEMPGFDVVNPVRGIKPGAVVIATVTDELGRTHPALATQPFGRGRCSAMMIGDLWRWGLRDEAMRTDMDRAWRQLVRWVIADVADPVQVVVEPLSDQPNEPVRLRVHARNESFEPAEGVSVKVTVQPVDGEPIELSASASLSEAGVYEATYVPREAGGYRVKAQVVDATGAVTGQAAAGWTSDPAAEEFVSLKPNHSLLEQLARQTGGQIVEASKLDAFVASLPQRRAPVTETWTRPLWHRPTMFLFALACLVAEWGLRRWKGAP